MSHNSIQVKLYDNQLKYITSIKLPVGTVPMPNTKLNVHLSTFGIYHNKTYLVNDVITQYVETDGSDGYGNFGETSVYIKLIVTLLSYETNKPKEIPPEPTKKKAVKKSFKN